MNSQQNDVPAYIKDSTSTLNVAEATVNRAEIVDAEVDLANPLEKSAFTNQCTRANTDALYNLNSRFGWKCFSPKLLQIINKPIFFLIFLCIGSVAQSFTATGISYSVLTSIEKQFGFKSSKVALFSTVYDTAAGICCIFVGYIGHAHRPRCIGLGFLVMVVGATLLSVPKFAIGTYYAGVSRNGDFCQRNVTSVATNCIHSTKWYYEFIFFLGKILIGIGTSPLYTLGSAHIDAVTRRGQGSLFMGIFFAFAAIGPALGFIIGMPLLNTWVDIVQPPNSSLTPKDSNWIGAWWLGYLIGAGLLFLPVVPLLGFPKEFPDAEVIRAYKLRLEDTVKENENLKYDLKSIWPATKTLFKNPLYVFICLAIATEAAVLGGWATFLAKFVQTQFHFTASNAGLYNGIIVILGAAGGIFLGGYLVKWCGWNCKQTLKASTILAFISMLFVAATFVGCAGRTVASQQGNRTGNLTAFQTECNKDCHCSREYYKPVCTTEDQQTYYSPCHAGCTKENTGDLKSFYNCSCFAPNVTYAVQGRCTSECTLFPLFAVLVFLMLLFTFMNHVPLLTATFRVVNEGQGSFAMGVQQIFVRFLGSIPGPILFGALIDKSCNLWQVDSCTGETTSCLEYDQAHFRYYLYILGIVLKFASFIFIFIAYKLYRLPENPGTSTVTLPEKINELDVNKKQGLDDNRGFSCGYANSAAEF